MPTPQHEALHRIFQEDTGLVARAFRRALRITFPAPVKVSALNVDLTELVPLERRVDTVLKAETNDSDHIVIVESQSRPDQTRRSQWPYYVAYLHSRYRCQVSLLVVCRDATTADWARVPIHTGPSEMPCQTTRPLVLGPDNVPAITDLGAACEDVVFAVLSALIHSTSPQASAILKVLASALDTIDAETAAHYAEFAEAGFQNTPAWTMWRTLMTTQAFPYVSQVRSQGREEGREEGRADGLREAVFRVLALRGIEVSDAARDQIIQCTDVHVLQEWLDRAMGVSSVDDLLAAERRG